MSIPSQKHIIKEIAGKYVTSHMIAKEFEICHAHFLDSILLLRGAHFTRKECKDGFMSGGTWYPALYVDYDEAKRILEFYQQTDILLKLNRLYFPTIIREFNIGDSVKVQGGIVGILVEINYEKGTALVYFPSLQESKHTSIKYLEHIEKCISIMQTLRNGDLLIID